MNKEFRIECNCHSRGHFVTFEDWEGDILACVVEADRNLPFFLRLKNIVVYLLGRRNFNYEEVVFNKKTARGLRNWLNKQLTCKKKPKSKKKK